MQLDPQRRSFERAIDAFHAAGAAEASWSDVARLACDAVGADSAAVVAWRTSNLEVEAFEGHGQEPGLVREYAEHYSQYDPQLQGVPAGGGWQVSNERFPDAQWSTNPFIGDLLHRYRIGQNMALTLQVGDDLMAALSLHRHTRTGTVAADFQTGQLARLTRAAVDAFSTRYATVHAVRRSLAQALASPSAYCYVSDAAGNARSLSALHPTGAVGSFSLYGGRAQHIDPAANARLRQLVARAAAGVRCSLSLKGGKGVVLRFEAQPLPAQAKLMDTQALALVHVETRSLDDLPDEADLQSLFDLTPAQSKVLRLLCEGLPPKKCAQRLNCSEATVRTHIAQLMQRMECSRQVQLVQAAMLSV
jgi:DNA-binding CsgD family transcriptional regulator